MTISSSTVIFLYFQTQLNQHFKPNSTTTLYEASIQATWKSTRDKHKCLSMYEQSLTNDTVCKCQVRWTKYTARLKPVYAFDVLFFAEKITVSAEALGSA